MRFPEWSGIEKIVGRIEFWFCNNIVPTQERLCAKTLYLCLSNDSVYQILFKWLVALGPPLLQVLYLPDVYRFTNSVHHQKYDALFGHNVAYLSLALWWLPYFFQENFMLKEI